MKQSNLPIKVDVVWASGAGAAYVREVPDASQINVTAGAASWTDGFVPLNMTPKASGGVPPAGQDTNGVLRRLSSWTQYFTAAGIVPYDATFQNSIGGYPLGSLVATGYTGASGTTGTLGRVWVSVVDGNTTNPDTGGAGWLYLCLPSDVLALVPTALTTAISQPPFNVTTAGSYSYTVPATGLYEFEADGLGGAGGAAAGSGAGGGGGGGGYIYFRAFLNAGSVVTGSMANPAQGAAAGTVNTGGSGATHIINLPGGTQILVTGGTGGAGANSGGSGLGGSGGTATIVAGTTPVWVVKIVPGQAGYQGDNVLSEGGQGGNSGSGHPGGPASHGNGNLGSPYGSGGGGSTAGGYGGNGYLGQLSIRRLA